MKKRFMLAGAVLTMSLLMTGTAYGAPLDYAEVVDALEQEDREMETVKVTDEGQTITSYVEYEDKVYISVKETVIRELPQSDARGVKKVTLGKWLNRIGVCENGWSVVTYRDSDWKTCIGYIETRELSDQVQIEEVSEEVTVVDRLKPYFRCTCGGKMVRLGGRWQDRSKVYLKCEHCGISVSLDTDETFQEVAHQMQTHECQEADAYVPSAEVIRLNNAINRGLEQPDSPEAVMALILQGAAARYDCCPQPISECEPSDCPVEVDWLRFRRVVSYITVASDAMVSLTFTDDNFTGKDK